MTSPSVPVPVEPVPGEPVRDKIVTAAEAVRLIRDGDAVVVGGFLGSCFPEELVLALQRRFLDGATPRDLAVVFTVAGGDAKGRGLDSLARPGLVRRAIGAHWAAAPALQKLAVAGEIEAYNLPLGSMCQLFRDIAAQHGTLDPREVKVPGALVDCVVVAPPEHHWQTMGTPYMPAYSGEIRVPMQSAPPLALTERKVIARRAAMELRPNSVVNLGVGLPEGVANVANEEHVLEYLTLTAERQRAPQVRPGSRPAVVQRAVRRCPRPAGAVRDRTVRVPAHRRGTRAHRDRPRGGP